MSLVIVPLQRLWHKREGHPLTARNPVREKFVGIRQHRPQPSAWTDVWNGNGETTITKKIAEKTVEGSPKGGEGWHRHAAERNSDQADGIEERREPSLRSFKELFKFVLSIDDGKKQWTLDFTERPWRPSERNTLTAVDRNIWPFHLTCHHEILQNRSFQFKARGPGPVLQGIWSGPWTNAPNAIILNNMASSKRQKVDIEKWKVNDERTDSYRHKANAQGIPCAFYASMFAQLIR